MSSVEIEVRRWVETEDELAIVRVTDASGRTTTLPATVGTSGQKVRQEVVPGVVRVDLRLANGDREQKTVRVAAGASEPVVFEPQASPHEFLTLESLVSPRASRARARERSAPQIFAPPRGTPEFRGRGIPLRFWLPWSGSVLSSLAFDHPMIVEYRDGALASVAALEMLPGRVQEIGPRPHRLQALIAQADDALSFQMRSSRSSFDRDDPVSSWTMLIPFIESVSPPKFLSVQLPPTSKFDLVLLPTSDEGGPPVDSEVIVYGRSIASLLEFLKRGDIEASAAVFGEMREDAELALYRKLEDPWLATVGAYVLVSLGPRPDDGKHSSQRPETIVAWLRNLAAWFPYADGPILWATARMQLDPGDAPGWFDDVRKALIEAVDRPTPILSRGIELWIDALLQIQLLQPAVREKQGRPSDEPDDELVRAIERARWIRQRMLPRETFTTLWLDASDLHRALTT